MTEAGHDKISREATRPQDGDRYCTFCGGEAQVPGPAVRRFGEVFCSVGHAEEFVKEVRAVRVQAAMRTPGPSTAGIEQSGGAVEGAPKRRNWKASLGKALCWGAPLLALVLVLGGGGAVLGAAGALLPFLALLACPLGMYFMMRSMSKMGEKEHPQDRGEEK